jgi:hypothetical protein
LENNGNGKLMLARNATRLGATIPQQVDLYRDKDKGDLSEVNIG